jgi:hypothetical protein
VDADGRVYELRPPQTGFTWRARMKMARWLPITAADAGRRGRRRRCRGARHLAALERAESVGLTTAELIAALKSARE